MKKRKKLYSLGAVSNEKKNPSIPVPPSPSFARQLCSSSTLYNTESSTQVLKSLLTPLCLCVELARNGLEILKLTINSNISSSIYVTAADASAKILLIPLIHKGAKTFADFQAFQSWRHLHHWGLKMPWLQRCQEFWIFNPDLEQKKKITKMAMRLDQALKLYIGLYCTAFIMTWLISVPMLMHVSGNHECLLFVSPRIVYGPSTSKSIHILIGSIKKGCVI